MGEIFRHPDLFLPPLIAGIALVAACAIMSVLVILKRLAFIGQGISHAGFGGVGLASFLAFGVSGGGDDSFIGNLIIFLFCLATGLAIAFLSRRKWVKIDTAIGILLVAAMAFGILLEQLRWQLVDIPWYQDLIAQRTLTSINWHAILFGSILDVTATQMYAAIAVALIIITILTLLAKEIAFYSFDERVSQVFGVPSGFIHYLILMLMAILIVFTMKLTGLILVNAFLVIPGATATLLSKRLKNVLIIALAVGQIGFIGGYFLCFALGGKLPVGPIVVLLLATQFALAWLLHWRKNRHHIA